MDDLTPYTVIGVWYNDEPIAAGAITGTHDVEGDLDYIGFQPWATTVEADDADDAMARAVQIMQDKEAP